MNNIRKYDAFVAFFDAIKTVIKEIGILDLPREDINSKNNLKQLQMVMNSATAEEYLFMKTRSADLYHQGCFMLPMQDKKEEIRVVLYGAGNEGKKMYEFLKGESKIKIVGWLDKEYKQYGFGIQAPEYIKELDYDFVFIAIESERIVYQVKRYLLEQGCDSNKIIVLMK